MKCTEREIAFRYANVIRDAYENEVELDVDLTLGQTIGRYAIIPNEDTGDVKVYERQADGSHDEVKP